MVNIIENLVSEDKYDIKCPYEMNPIGITVHNTSNSASAENEISYMIRNNKETSYHFAVDENNAIQGIPLNRNAWHAGDGNNGSGNRETIGIEIARSTHDDESLFDIAEDNAAKLCAKLCIERGWTVDNIYTHQHWSGKYCPHKTLDRGWDRFIDMVQEYINQINESNESNEVENTTEGVMSREEAENYIRTCYVEYLNRIADADGLEMYANALVNGEMTLDDVDDAIKSSDEYNTPYSQAGYKRNFIVKCYDLCLGRFPENESVIEEKMAMPRLRDIFECIYNSEEAQNYRS